jgi:hypothetical protein
MTAHPTTSSQPCGCSPDGGAPTTTCSAHDLPADPFVDLRVAYGMLLGEDDFRVLMANPRGKQQLHTSWLHGTGVVWGMHVVEAADQLRVDPGLAIDGVGRELRLEDAGWCVTTAAWAKEWRRDHPGTVIDDGNDPKDPKDKNKDKDANDCETRRLEAWVVAEFGCCFDRPVPTLADPCDVTRTQSGPSRIVETCRITTVADRPSRRRTYHRVRVLLGLDVVGTDDKAGREALHARELVEEATGDDRARALLHWFRRLAARDEMDLEPHACAGDAERPWTPVTEECAPVLLARLEVDVREQGGCLEVLRVGLDNDVRHALLPTSTIQDLVCGLAPGILGVDTEADAGGPRLVPGSLEWTGDHTRLSFRVTARLTPGSGEGAVAVSSLSDEGHGWADDDVERVRISDDGLTVHAYLDARPKYETVRIIIRGTGRRTLFGADPHVPFAGVVGGPPGTADDGHDALITQHLGSHESHESRRSAS